MDDYDYCYECSGYGDDYHLDENGELPRTILYSLEPGDNAGLVTLMGLFLLYRLTGTLVIADLPGLCAGVADSMVRAISAALASAPSSP